jgi:hypothetical protein
VTQELNNIPREEYHMSYNKWQDQYNYSVQSGRSYSEANKSEDYCPVRYDAAHMSRYVLMLQRIRAASIFRAEDLRQHVRPKWYLSTNLYSIRPKDSILISHCCKDLKYHGINLIHLVKCIYILLHTV